MTSTHSSDAFNHGPANASGVAYFDGVTEETGQWHIISLVAYCKTEAMANFKQNLEQMPGVELHADDGHAKLILTIEGKSTTELSERMDELQDSNDLLSLQMVFHQQDQSTSEPSQFITNSEDVS